MRFKPVNYIAAGIMLLFCQNAFAQTNAPVSGQRLEAIEHEMFNDSNANFIFIDLIMDGLMKPGDDYVFQYNNGIVYWRGKKMSKKWQEKYTVRFKEFLQYTGTSTGLNTTFNSGSATAEKILDPNSTFRKAEPPGNFYKLKRWFAKQQQRDDLMHSIIGQMASEHVLDTVADYYLEFNQTGVFINKQKLEGAAGDKYFQLFKTAMNYAPDGKGYYFIAQGGHPVKK